MQKKLLKLGKIGPNTLKVVSTPTITCVPQTQI